MPAIGYIQVHTYTTNAQIPVVDAAIAITDSDGNALALLLTNQNGMLDEPVELEVPDLSAGQSPNTGILPYSIVNIYARAPDFEEIIIKNLQVFPDTVTNQNLELIPLSEFPETWNQAEIFDTQTQNL
jgi:hypothetical protein